MTTETGQPVTKERHIFWRIFQLAVFAGFMWIFIDAPGEKNMAAAGIVSSMFALMLTQGLSSAVDLTKKLAADFRLRQHEKAKKASFVRREPFL